ncbi:MAG TPA: dihydrofolate reductase family protein, partial [Candidatus Limnocylindria bacterium]|nr:dihydrofolate reductase family protein [Candidatus Limnocylindria bacterium]
MRRLFPTPLDVVDPALEFAVPSGQHWLRATMVATIDGAVTDAAGRSGGISGEPDRRLFRVLRSVADAVVVGARTAQAERYHRAEQPVVLLSRTLDLDLTTPLLATPRTQGAGEVLVIAPKGVAPARRDALEEHASAVGGIELLTAGEETLDLRETLHLLRDRGLEHLHGEGGPAVLAALLAEGLVDELCLTTAPYVVGGASARIVGDQPDLT